MTKFLLLYSLFVANLLQGQSYLQEFPFRQKTKYFSYHLRQNNEACQEVVRFADAFIDLVNRDFFTATFDYPITVLVVEDHGRFQSFVRRNFQVKDPPNFGIYFSAIKTFVTRQDAGLGTFAHEIMHPLVERNLPDRPIWAMEAIPTFFEKFYGYWQDDKPILYWGFHNPWRIEMLGTMS